ncbi:MAG: M16 family metallopeptidase, partial [Terriglobales bacterium]
MKPRTLLSALVFAAGLALPCVAPAQAPVQGQAVIPVSNAPLQVKLPRPVVATLPNGLTVLMLENHRLPTITLYLEIRGAGGFDEPAGQPGLANFTAQMMSLGTATRTSTQIADQAASLGAFINVGAGYGLRTAVLSASGLSNNFPQWFALATDILLHPSFPAEEWTKLRQQAEVGLRQQRTNPGFLAKERFDLAVYGSFPAAVDTTTVEALGAMTPAAFAAWHAQRYVPQNAVLAIAGDIEPQALLAWLRTALGGWQRSDSAVGAPGMPTAPSGRRVFL